MDNILKGGIRNLARKTKDPELKRALGVIQDEAKRLEAAIPQMTPTPTPAQVTIGGSTSSGSGGTPVSSSNDRASWVAITSVVDQFISFSSAIPVGYVLTVWFQDSTGAQGPVAVKQSDWLPNGFWLRAALSIPASSILFYIAKANK